MAIKKALWTRIANGIICVGKKILNASIENCKKAEDHLSKITEETIKISPPDIKTETTAVNSVEVTKPRSFSDDDDDLDDFWGFQKKHSTCTIDVDDTNDIVNKKIDIYIEGLDETQKFNLSEDTVLLGVDTPGKYQCIFEYEKNTHTKKLTGKILCIADTELYKYFLDIEDLRKRVSNIAGFVSCSDEQRAFILKNVSKTETLDTESSELYSTEAITDPRSLETMFNLCKKSLPYDLRMKCEDLVKDLHRGSKRADEASAILSDILNTSFPEEKQDVSQLPSYDECIRILKKHHLGDDDLIEYIARQIRLHTRCACGYTVFVLLGPPGVGKTSLAKAIAECLRLPFEEIPCRNRNPVCLGGVSRIYDGARRGEVMERIRKHRGKLLLLLDEFDKTADDPKEGDTSSMFDSVFDDRRCFNDRFSNFPCSVENVVFVITCNDMEGVSTPIVDRFGANIFTIPAYDNDKKAQIGKEFIVPKLMDEYKFKDDDVVFCEDGLLAIAETTTDSGARIMSQQVENILAVANNCIERGETTPIRVDKAFVNKYAKKAYSYENEVGVKSIKGFCA